jgi:hypothetical protein
MAARKRRINHDPKTIEKIRSSQLINALIDHALGKNDMQSTQVTAALGLIKKVMPDLAAVQQEISGPDGNPIETKWTVEVVDAKPTDT